MKIKQNQDKLFQFRFQLKCPVCIEFAVIQASLEQNMQKSFSNVFTARSSRTDISVFVYVFLHIQLTTLICKCLNENTILTFSSTSLVGEGYVCYLKEN